MRGVGGTSLYSSAVIRIHVTAKKQRTDPARFRTFQQYRSSRRRRTAVAFAHWGTCVIETRDASDFGYGAVEGGVAITRFGALLMLNRRRPPKHGRLDGPVKPNCILEGDEQSGRPLYPERLPVAWLLTGAYRECSAPTPFKNYIGPFCP